MKVISQGQTDESFVLIECPHCKSELKYADSDVLKIVDTVTQTYNPVNPDLPPEVKYRNIIVCPVCRKWIDV